jgi:hypothetical protein
MTSYAKDNKFTARFDELAVPLVFLLDDDTFDGCIRDSHQQFVKGKNNVTYIVTVEEL